MKRGIQLYKVGVDLAKETLYARSQIETPGPKYLNFPNNLDSEFYEGFCSEVQVTKHKNGHPYMVWEKLNGVRNEPLDLMVYSMGAAHLAGVTRMNWDKIEKELLASLVELQSNVRSYDSSNSERSELNNKSSESKVRSRKRNVQRKRGRGG